VIALPPASADQPNTSVVRTIDRTGPTTKNAMCKSPTVEASRRVEPATETQSAPSRPRRNRPPTAPHPPSKFPSRFVGRCPWRPVLGRLPLLRLGAVAAGAGLASDEGRRPPQSEFGGWRSRCGIWMAIASAISVASGLGSQSLPRCLRGIPWHFENHCCAASIWLARMISPQRMISACTRAAAASGDCWADGKMVASLTAKLLITLGSSSAARSA
jgi:hypothetical protein